MTKLIQISILIILLSCSNDEKTTRIASNDFPVTDSASQTQPYSLDTKTYSILLNKTSVLSLQQWDSTINLQHYLGKPVKQITKQIDENSDTHSGSFLKELEWPGVKLQLFSPPQNGKTFWVQEIILTDNQYQTIDKIRIGDSMEKVRKAYPKLEKFPGDNENMFFVANENYEKSIEMEFENNILKNIRMYYMLQ